MTTTTTPAASQRAKRATLSDEAAAEPQRFVAHVLLLYEWRYGSQVRRHIGELHQIDTADPHAAPRADDPPF
jgi:hypothetical protein